MIKSIDRRSARRLVYLVPNQGIQLPRDEAIDISDIADEARIQIARVKKTLYLLAVVVHQMTVCSIISNARHRICQSKAAR